MRLKLRVRTNDVKTSYGHDAFIHFDNCTEVKVNKFRYFDLDNDKELAEYKALTARASNGMPVRPIRSETGKQFDAIHYMVRDFGLTMERVRKSETNLTKESNPFHLGIIEWQDRITEKWHRLVFDTVVFVQADNGDTLERAEG